MDIQAIYCIWITLMQCFHAMTSQKEGLQDKPSKISSLLTCDADIVIAGLFPIRLLANQIEEDNKKLIFPHDASLCAGGISPTGLQEALAMIYAVHNVNRDQTILPNCSIGLEIANTCGNNEFAIKNCLSFDFVPNQLSSSLSLEHNSRTVAVVGLRKSTVSNSVATFTNLFGMPTISYGATDHLLSNRVRFPMFARTVPSNHLLAKAIYSILNALDWNIAFAIYDLTDFGISGFSLFQKLLDSRNAKHKKYKKICIAHDFEASDVLKRFSVFDNKLRSFPDARTIILFMHKEKATLFLQKVFERDRLKAYNWIFCEGISFTHGLKKMFASLQTGNVVISLQPSSFNFRAKQSVLLDFIDFVEEHINDKVLQKILPDLKACVTNKCLQSDGISYFLPYVMDAIYAVAHALHATGQSCGSVTQLKRSLMSFILDVKFKSVLGYDFEFDTNGDAKGQYDILVLRETRNVKMELAGTWDCKTETVNWTNLSTDYLFPSNCNPICEIGWGRVQKVGRSDCCSTCEECLPGEYSDVKEQLCKTCPEYFVPNHNKTSCNELKEEIINVTSVVGIAMVTAAMSGQIITLFVILVFLKFRNTHVVRASNWDTSITTLAGAFLSFSSSYIIMGKVTDTQCKLNVIGSGLSLSLMIGSLFVKTNRIHRLLRKDVLRKGLPRFLGRGWQLLIVIFITVCGTFISLSVAFYPSDPVRYHRVLSASSNITHAMCHYNTEILYGWWVFHGILIGTCTYQTILSRNVPSHHNEARNVMFAMLAVALEMVFSLLNFYLGTVGLYRQLHLMLINLVSACSTLVFVFFPKLFIIFFRPSENKEPLPHGTLGTFVKTELRQAKPKLEVSELNKQTIWTTTFNKQQLQHARFSDRNEYGERNIKRRKVGGIFSNAAVERNWLPTTDGREAATKYS